MPTEPVDEPLAREDRRCGHGDVALRFRALVELNAAPFLEQRALDERRIGKLVRESARTIRAGFEQVFDDPRMAPGEQLIQVAELPIQLVVSSPGRLATTLEYPRQVCGG